MTRGAFPRCARRGCRKGLPRLARLHGDPYCSTTCCRIAHGLHPSTAKKERAA